MARVSASVARHRRHKKVLKQAKGYWGGRRRLYRTAREAVQRSWAYAYRDRKVRKREFRCLWIERINAAARQHGTSYSRLVAGLRKAGVDVNRKILADLAVHDPTGFEELVRVARGGGS